MNKIYKVIYCKATQTWVAVSEITKSHGKGGVYGAVRRANSTFNGRMKLLSLSVLLGLGSVNIATAADILYINGGDNGNCINIRDTTSQAIQWSNPECSPSDKATQKKRALFYDESNAGKATSLTLGGELYVNTKAVLTSTTIKKALTVEANSTIDMGNNRVQNVGTPTADSDAATKKYVDDNASHYYSVNNGGTAGANYNNDGATGTNALAAGVGTKATGEQSTALGNGATAKGASGIVGGTGANAGAQKGQTTAVGYGATANGNWSTAVGANATAKPVSTVIGANVSTTGAQAVAIGGSNNVALKAATAGEKGVAIGVAANATSTSGTQGVAVGNFAAATGDQSTAVGANSVASGASSIAIGGDDLDTASNTNIDGSIATTGGEQVPNWNNTGTITLNAGEVATKFKENTGLSLVDTTTPGVGGTQYQLATASGASAIAVGTQATAKGHVSTAFGTRTNADGFASVALGTWAQSHVENSVALGAGSLTTDQDLKDSSGNAVTNPLGGNLNGSATKETQAQITASDGSTITYTGFFAGADALKAGDQVSVGAYGYERQIKNVAPGAVHAKSTDAINGSQLYSVAKTLQDSNVTYFHTNDGTAVVPSATNKGKLGDKAGAGGAKSLAAGVNATVVGPATGGIAVGAEASVGDRYSMALGYDAYATSSFVNAIGYKAEAKVTSATAIGNQANAKGTYSIALGTNTVSSGTSSIAAGTRAKTGKPYATAMGFEANASGERSQALGANAEASGLSAVAVGDRTDASGTRAIAIGAQNDASGDNSISMGTLSNASKTSAIALGSSSKASVERGVALGSSSTADRAATTAGAATSDAPTVGTTVYALADATTADKNAISATVKGTLGAVSVGKSDATRQITNVAAGAADSDAVNVAQLRSVASAANRDTYFHTNDGTAVAYDATETNKGKLDATEGAFGVNSLAAGVKAHAVGSDTVAVGSNTRTHSNNSTAIGNGATAGKADGTGLRATAIGTSSEATGSDSLALAYKANATGTNSIAIGNAAQSAGTDGVTGAELAGYSTAVGGVSSAAGQYATAIGYHSDATKEYATALGNNAQATGVSSIAIGGSTTTEAATASGEGSISIGRLSDATNEHATAVGLGSQATGKWSSAYGKNSQASKESATAVGDTAKALAENASAFGSDAVANTAESVALGFNSATGGSSGKSVAIGSGSRALADGSIALGSSSNANRAATTAGAATSDAPAVGTTVYALADATTADKTAISGTVKGTLGAVSVGKSDATRQITNVAAGAADSDAVNVAQLKAVANVASKGWGIGNDDAQTATVVGNVAPGERVDFVSADTNTVTVDVTDDATNGKSEVKIGVKSDGDLTANTSGSNIGKIGTPTKPNALVTATTVANAINNSGFTVTSSANGGTNTGSSNELVNPGDTLELVAGEHIKIVQDKGKFTFSTNNQAIAEGAQLPVVYTKPDGTKVYKHTDGKFYDAPNGGGNLVATNTVIASMQNADGTTKKPTTLANVAGNLDGANGNAAPTTGATKPSTLKENNAATVGDVLNAGWNLQEDGTAKDFVTAYDTVNFIDTDTTAVTIDSSKGTSKIKVDVQTITLATDTDGKTTVPTSAADKKKLVNAGDVANAINASGFTLTTSKSGTGTVSGTSNELVNPGETVTIDAGDNIAVTQANGKITVATKKDVAFDKVTIGSVVIDKTSGINAGNKKITGVAAGTISSTSTDAINGSQLHAVSSVANAGFTIKGAAATTASDDKIKPNDTFNIVGADANNDFTKSDAGKNIYTVVDTDNTVRIGLAKDVVVDSVKAGDTTINNDGMTITGGPSVTKTGINAGGKKVTGVSSGLVDGSGNTVTIATATGDTLTNAANIGDLQKVQAAVGNVYQVIGGQNTSGNAVDADGNTLKDANGNPINAKLALKTYDVAGQTATDNNTVISAIKNMNEGGIKYFHTNDQSGQKVGGAVANTDDSSASGSYSTAIGYQASATAENAIAFGKGSQATAKNTIAIGTGNVVKAANSGAIGDPSYISDKAADGTAVKGSYSIGNDNYINTSNTFVLGNNVNTIIGQDKDGDGINDPMGDTVANSIYLGNQTTATAGNKVGTVNLVADGTKGKTTTAGDTGTVENATVGGITYGGFAGATASGVVSVGASGTERRVQNMAAGEISATSTDAINGSQLYATNRQVSSNAVNIANNAQNIKDNRDYIIENSKGIKGNADNIAKGLNFAGNEGNFNRQLGDTVGIGGTLAKDAAASSSNIRTVAKDGVVEILFADKPTFEEVNIEKGLIIKEGAIVNMGNNRVQGVADGVNPTDAVNVRQLDRVRRYVDSVDNQAQAGIAAALATASLPQPHDPGASMVSVGMGAHRSEQAIAIGLSSISDNGKWVIKGSLSQDTESNTSAGVGVGYQW